MENLVHSPLFFLTSYSSFPWFFSIFFNQLKKLPDKEDLENVEENEKGVRKGKRKRRKARSMRRRRMRTRRRTIRKRKMRILEEKRSYSPHL